MRKKMGTSPTGWGLGTFKSQPESQVSSPYQRTVTPDPDIRPCMMLFGRRYDWPLSALVVT